MGQNPMPPAGGQNPNDGQSWGAPPQSGGQQWGAAPTGGPAPQAGGQWGAPGGAPGGGMPGGAPGGQWSPPPGGAPPPPTKSGGGCGKVLLILGLLGVVGIGAIVAIAMMIPGTGEAEILTAEVYEEQNPRQARLRFTYVLTELPEDADPQSLRLVVSSIALTQELSWDWAYLSTKDNRPETTPDSIPPLGTEIEIDVVIEQFLQETVHYYDTIGLNAVLEWADTEKDTYYINMMHIYPNPA